MPAFGPHLAHLLKARGMTQRAFGQAVGISPGNLYHLIHTGRPPPLRRIESMAEILQLRGSERTAFIELASMLHAPEVIQHALHEARLEIARLRLQLAPAARSNDPE